VARRNLDLAVVALAAAFGAGVEAATSSPVAALVPGLLLALLAPGYAVAAALLPRTSGDRAERAMVVVGCGLAALVLTSVLLAAAGIRFDSSRTDALLAVTFTCCAIAAARRGGEARSTRHLPRISPRAALAVVPIAAMLAGAAVVARVPAKNVSGYTSLWVGPASSSPQGTFLVGVRSDETAVMSYLLTAREGGRVVLSKAVTLRPGQSWTASASIGTVTAGLTKTVEVRLVNQASPAKVYRHVYLTFGSGF
jgi:hypothetical protein